MCEKCLCLRLWRRILLDLFGCHSWILVLPVIKHNCYPSVEGIVFSHSLAHMTDPSSSFYLLQVDMSPLLLYSRNPKAWYNSTAVQVTTKWWHTFHQQQSGHMLLLCVEVISQFYLAVWPADLKTRSSCDVYWPSSFCYDSASPFFLLSVD